MEINHPFKKWTEWNWKVVATIFVLGTVAALIFESDIVINDISFVVTVTIYNFLSLALVSGLVYFVLSIPFALFIYARQRNKLKRN
ncbi:hypothetical protein KS2013_1638 [Kangiella sediminilitoris]|uniref:Uncharacterized protein n=1 Tax=Kangiella sediminilitoris TaxID=1144748 RepID=A0A1B3BC26_9GAMM|nr:hypothetical protein KS2013_1638 [Kangiella sediminilitoris]